MGFIQKTFGGIKRSFYIREFLFGFPIYAFLLYTMFREPKVPEKTAVFQWGLFIFATIQQLLYPYARFVYHSVTDYILGKDVYIVNTFILLIVRFFTMIFCWFFAIFIAPLGLIYLYFRNRKM